MNRLRKIIASMALIALLPWNAALALPSAPESPNCDFNGDVFAVKAMPDGTIYAGGNFTGVTCDSGVTNYTPSHVAKILPNGQFDPTWDNKGVNGTVLALEVDGTRLYVGGSFTEAIGNPVNYGYNNIAALELATGYADTSFMEEDIGAGTDGPVYTIINNTYNGAGIIIGGDFNTVSDSFVNLAHSGIGFLAFDGLVEQSYGHLSLMNAGGYANALALDGSTLYIGGAFDTVAWDVGSVIRNNMAAVDLALDASADSAFVISTFNPDLNAEVRAIAIDTANARIFLGGDFTQAKINTTHNVAKYLHPFTTATGQPDLVYNAWPNASVTDLDLDSGELFITGNFTDINFTARNFAGSLNVSAIPVLLASWDPSPDTNAHTIEVTSNRGAMGGNFTTVGGLPAANFARFGTVPPPSTSISGTVFEDVNFGQTFGRSRASAYADGGQPLPNVRVEIYDAPSGNLLAQLDTDSNGEYSWNAPGAGDYIVRVADETVSSTRPLNAPASGLMAVSTFFTDGGMPITDRVGGAEPDYDDSLQNNGTQTFSDLTLSTNHPQTFGTVTVVGDETNVDFGYNFDTVVNNKDSGRGSLRSAITNANALSNTGLAQAGFASGVENVVFKIPRGLAGNGLNPSYNFFDLTQDAARVVLASDLPIITETLYFDAQSQPSLGSNTSTPVIIDSAGYSYGLQFTAPNNHIRGLSFVNAANTSLTFADGGNEISDSLFGIFPSGIVGSMTGYQIFFQNDAASANNTIGGSDEPNAFGSAGNTAVYFDGVADNASIIDNRFGLARDGVTQGYCYNGIVFAFGGADVTIGGSTDADRNVFANCQNIAIATTNPNTEMTRLSIQNNIFGSDVTGMVALSSSNPMYFSRTVDFQLGNNTGAGANLFVSVNQPAQIEHATGTRIYGNTFGLYADGITPAPISSGRSVMFTLGSTDTEIGDGTVDGTNVFGGGMGGIEFSDNGSITHHDVRLRGNKIGVDRTGLLPIGLLGQFGFSRIDGLLVGGLNPGEGNQMHAPNATAIGVSHSNGVRIYGNNCSGNPDVSAVLAGSNTGCVTLDDTDGAIVGAPGSGRNYFGGENSALTVYGSEQVTIQNNYFNLNASGSAPLLSHALRGLSIGDSTNTMVGGINPGEANYFGSYHGSLVLGDLGMAIDIQGNNGVWVQGNTIGTDATGTIPYEGDFGIGIAGNNNPASNIVIGGATAAHGNTIFGGMGIVAYGPGVNGALIQNNDIGVNTLGSVTSSGAQLTPLPFGVLKPTGIAIIWGAHDNVIQENTIGGTPSYAGGSGPGIYLAQDQNSPFGPTPVPLGNRITKNVFKDNAGLSIDLENTVTGAGGDGVSANDGIVDPTRVQNGLDYPIITSSTLVGGTLFVEGHVGSGLGLSAFADIEVEIYEQDNDGNQNGEINVGDGLSIAHGEGLNYLGTIMTDSSGGNFSGSVSAPFLSSSTKITAIAIDQLNNTSEFGAFYDGLIAPPVPPAPPTPLVQGGTGGLSCNLSNPFNPGNGCHNAQSLSVTAIPTPEVPLVPMPWLNESTTTKPVICQPLITKYLKMGAANDSSQVKLLQEFLKQKDGAYKGAINGTFDKATDVAVRAFQKKYAKEVLGPWGHDTPTGYVYITTSRKINALNCQR